MIKDLTFYYVAKFHKIISIGFRENRDRRRNRRARRRRRRSRRRFGLYLKDCEFNLMKFSLPIEN